MQRSFHLGIVCIAHTDVQPLGGLIAKYIRPRLPTKLHHIEAGSRRLQFFFSSLKSSPIVGHCCLCPRQNMLPLGAWLQHLERLHAAPLGGSLYLKAPDLLREEGG